MTVPCGVAFVGREDDRIVVWLRGEHDSSTLAALSETVAGAFALDDADVVVDLSGVEFMGVATVGLIIRAGEFLRLRSRCLALRAPSTCARRILDLCGLAGLLDPRSVMPRVTGTTGALGTWVAVPATTGLTGALTRSRQSPAAPRMRSAAIASLAPGSCHRRCPRARG